MASGSDPPQKSTVPSRLAQATVTSNDRYVAYTSATGIHVLDIASETSWDYQVTLDGCHSRATLPFALSICHPELVAISKGSQILILNVSTHEIVKKVPGNGRVVTAISWSRIDADVLATVTTDGSICIWEVNGASRRQYHVPGLDINWSNITFSSVDKDVLATTRHDKLAVLVLDAGPRWVQRGLEPDAGLNLLTWHPSTPGRLITHTKNGDLTAYDFAEAITNARTTGTRESNHVEGGTADEHVKILAHGSLNSAAKQLLWIGQTGVLALARNGKTAIIHSLIEDSKEFVELWSCDFKLEMDTLRFRQDESHILLHGIGLAGIESHEAPSAVHDSIGWQQTSVAPILHSPSSHKLLGKNTKPSSAPRFECDKHSKITPFPISDQHGGASGLKKTKIQFHKRVFLKKDSAAKSRYHYASESNVSESSLTSIREGMTSSLQFTQSSKSDRGSPMPFLSPSIPSRRTQPHDVAPRRDSLAFSPLQLPLSASPLPSTVTEHDSDSDDDTFADGLGASRAFLPGGVHVPLPKACGALFGPNGQLLTYFPRRARPLSVMKDKAELDRPKQRESQAHRVARLYPGFGNLASDSNTSDVSFDSDGISDDAMTVEDGEIDTDFSLQPSSFPRQQLQDARALQTKFEASQEQKIVVSVRNMEDVSELFPEQFNLAKEYQILCEGDKSGADLCRQNASVAEQAGLQDNFAVWHLLAALLEDKVPLDVLSSTLGDLGFQNVVRAGQTMIRDDSSLDLIEGRNRSGEDGKLRWADHPFGGAWLVRKLFNWVEQRGDTQMLACMSAILAEVERARGVERTARKYDMVKKLATYTPDYLSGIGALSFPRLVDCRSKPILKANTSMTIASADDSPTKLLRSESGTSSRNQSQPATPHLDSSASTPSAFAWSSSSRQNTRLSASTTSGSVAQPASISPEHTRGSFGAAARNYAQTITDKFADRFASYGTSPPIRKGAMAKSGGSPGSYEQLSSSLSTSLPRGSFGKSVSFASTADTAQGSGLSRSYDGQTEFRRPGIKGDEGYESDRTVDGSSAVPPLSPKGLSNEVTIKFKNQDAFADSVSGGAKMPLIPPDMKFRCTAWMEYYAEQLRTWELWEPAADLDKVASFAGASVTRTSAPVTLENGVVAQSINAYTAACLSGREETHGTPCSICCTLQGGLQYTCPACLHAAHIDCLDDYASLTIAEGSSVTGSPVGSYSLTSASVTANGFTCPAGCGCNCVDLAYLEFGMAPSGTYENGGKSLHDEEDRPISTRTVVKKISFTDPRRWREKIEGDPR